MIWGITLEPGQAYTEVIEDEVHLSMATMESRGCIGSKADNFSHVVIKTGTAEYLLCTLVNGITYQQCLDLKLMPSDKVTFSVQGTNVVYLTGYSFVTSEADQEITETEDWIEDPMLEDVPQDNIEYSGDDSRFLPSDETVQRQHPNTGEEEEDNSTDLSDREQYSVQYEVPAAEQQYQHLPERGHHQTTLGVPSRSSHGQPQQHPPRVTDGSSFIIKEEIHTIVDTEEDTPPDQTNEEIHNQSRNQTIHQPSTSTGQNCQGSRENILLNITHPLTPRKTDHVNCAGQSDSNSGRSSEVSAEIFVPPDRVDDSTSGNRRHTIGLKYESRMVQKLKCRFCGEEFFYPSRLKIHETKHTGERNYKCNLCGKSFRLQSNKIAHETIHTGVRPFQCGYCGKRFRQQSVLKTHERIHTGERPYMCVICGKAFRQHGHLEKHSRKHERVIHLSVASESDGSCTGAWGLSKMAEDKQYLGDRRKSSVTQDHDFLQQKDVSLPQSKGRSYTLSEMSSPYRRSGSMSAKQQTRGRQRKRIVTANSTVGNWGGIRLVGGRGNFECIYCGKCFRDFTSKEQHETKHQCRYCKKLFNMPRQREQHELIHTGERPHKCSFCMRGFRDAGSKVQHERIHTGEKPYKCGHCGMCFTHRESKRRHERTHAPDLN